MANIDQNLIVKASKGDAEAFKVIYEEYFSMVSNIVYRISNRRDDVEDVTQEIFISIYNNLKNFRFASSLKTWIYRIAVNHAINHAKKSFKPQNQTMEYFDIHDSKDLSHDPRQRIDQESFEQNISALLEAINPDQRACLILRSVDGLSYQEIAETLKIPVNTVRSRIKRARETMLALRKQGVVS